jgi:predicted aconitase with swiveling domain
VDTFFALAAFVAQEMFGHAFPVIAISSQAFASLETGVDVRILEDGTLQLDG